MPCRYILYHFGLKPLKEEAPQPTLQGGPGVALQTYVDILFDYLALVKPFLVHIACGGYSVKNRHSFRRYPKMVPALLHL